MAVRAMEVRRRGANRMGQQGEDYDFIEMALLLILATVVGGGTSIGLMVTAWVRLTENPFQVWAALAGGLVGMGVFYLTICIPSLIFTGHWHEFWNWMEKKWGG